MAPAGLWLTLEAGKIDAADSDPASGRVTLTLSGKERFTPVARLLVETTVAGARPYSVDGAKVERGACTIPLAGSDTRVTLTPR